MRPISVSSSHWNGWNNVITRKILTDGKPLFNFGLHPEGWIAITRFDGDCESCVLEHEYYFSRSDSELLLVNYILNRSDEKVYFYENNNLIFNYDIENKPITLQGINIGGGTLNADIFEIIATTNINKITEINNYLIEKWGLSFE